MLELLRAFAWNDDGQGLVEYALILGLIAVVAIVGLNALGSNTNSSLGNSDSQLKNAFPQ
jgi:pilus assembly protein Flp/PilA